MFIILYPQGQVCDLKKGFKRYKFIIVMMMMRIKVASNLGENGEPVRDLITGDLPPDGDGASLRARGSTRRLPSADGSLPRGTGS